jgi:hypothetical protein
VLAICDDVLKSQGKTAVERSIRLIIATNESTANEQNQRDIRFTVRSGFALFPSCDAGEPSQRFRQLTYYPVGLAVKVMSGHQVLVKNTSGVTT